MRAFRGQRSEVRGQTSIRVFPNRRSSAFIGGSIFQILCVVFLVLVATASVMAAEAGGEAHQSIGMRIAEFFHAKGVPQWLVVMVISTLPIVELRGAIPVAHVMGMNPVLAYVLAVMGNMVPVFPLLMLLGPASSLLSRFHIFKVFFDWFFARTRRKSAVIEEYETIGLALFVAIPLPVTGAWTGCAAAFLFGIRFRHAVWAILLGVMIAGVIMTILSLMGLLGAIVAGAVLMALLIFSLIKMFKKEERGAQGSQES